MTQVVLRDVTDGDLPAFFQHQKDPVATQMAAFTSKDRNDWDSFVQHWTRIRNDAGILNKTVTVEHLVVGHVASFEQFGEREVTYWIDRAYWGKGIATDALKQFLTILSIRPLYARAAKDNVGSRRVLEKNGFVITGEDRGWANARQAETEEFIFTLSS